MYEGINEAEKEIIRKKADDLSFDLEDELNDSIKEFFKKHFSDLPYSGMGFRFKEIIRSQSLVTKDGYVEYNKNNQRYITLHYKLTVRLEDNPKKEE